MSQPIARRLRALGLAAIVLALAACASNIPLDVRKAPANNPTVTQVRDNAKSFVGSTARWGGVIARVENKETETWIELVEKRLQDWGRPIEADQSQGRFIARIQGFLDPMIYKSGRELTVAGIIEEPIVSKIGEFTYIFPVLRAEIHYLWEPQPDVIYYEPMPFFYYDPWYPYRYPYWRYPYW